MVTRFEKILPAEQWQQIFKYVPPGDLCRVVTTSRKMNGLASWPKLWTDMTVNVRKVRDDGLAQFYSIDRFKRITKLDFENVTFTSEQLESLLNDMDGSPLENINFNDTDFSDISSEVLARAVGQLKTFKLFSYQTGLTTDQCIKLLETIVSSTTLVNVKLENQVLGAVPDELLANAVSGLQEVSLKESSLTTDQCIRLLDASLSSGTLVKIDLSYVDLAGVPTQLLVKAVCRLKTVKLGWSFLTDHQSLHLLEGMISSSPLVSVDLGFIDLSGVPAWMLSKAVCRLEAVNLWRTDLTTSQTIKLLKSTLSSTTLAKLNLNAVNLSEVPADVISRVVCRLSVVDLGSSLYNRYLTSLQCAQILETIPTSSTLVKLGLRGADLSLVSAEVLSNAVDGLQSVDLSFTNLTTGQCVSFLEATIASKTMVRVYLARVNLGEVPAGLLVKAVRKLKTFKLDSTQLTSDQCVEIVNAILSSTTVCKTNLYGNDITEKVPAETLASLPPHVYGVHND